MLSMTSCCSCRGWGATSEQGCAKATGADLKISGEPNDEKQQD